MSQNDNAVNDNATPNPVQFSLKEILIGVTVLGVVFAIARMVGGVGVADFGVFAIGAASMLLATSRLFTWLGVGALFGIVTAVLTQVAANDPQAALISGAGVIGFYAFVGVPIAIAQARKLHMRRWLISELGILTVSTAFTPADPISTLLVYVPLQLAMIGYVFFAKDGKPAPEA